MKLCFSVVGQAQWGGGIPTCDSAHSWWLYSAASLEHQSTSTSPWPTIPLSLIILTLSQSVLAATALTNLLQPSLYSQGGRKMVYSLGESGRNVVQADQARLFVCLLLLYLLASCQVISRWAPICHSAYSWWLYSVAPLGHQTARTQGPRQTNHIGCLRSIDLATASGLGQIQVINTSAMPKGAPPTRPTHNLRNLTTSNSMT